MHGFSGVGVVLRFPGFHREFTGVWAPKGHPDRRGLGAQRVTRRASPIATWYQSTGPFCVWVLLRVIRMALRSRYRSTIRSLASL
jgi:hypothetical protein